MKNNTTYIDKKMSNWIFWGMSFILILPILIIPPNFQPSDWTRVILFKIALTILVSLLLYKFFNKKDAFFSVPEKGFLFYLPLLALTGFFIVSIISTITSEDIIFSVFGSPARSGGTLNFTFFFIFAILLAVFIKGEYWNKLMKVNFMAGFLASLLAIVQYFGLFKNIFLGFETGATPSFFGNSTLLAIYMIFLVFSSFTFFISEKNKKEKAIYGSLFLLFLFTIFVTSARASYIGTLIGFSFYFLFFPIKLVEPENTLVKWVTKKRLKAFKIAFASFVFLVLLTLIYVNTSSKLPGFIENNKRLSYVIHNRLSFKIVAEDLAGTRLSAWKITANAIKEKPMLGWGPENFHIGFEKYFDPTLPPSLQKLWWDRPHNIFLEIWANSGIFALIFYLAFWLILLWQLQMLKNRTDDTKNSYDAHAIQAMFIGYLTALFFNFDSFATHLISFFFIGYALYLLSAETEKITINPPARLITLKKPLTIFLAIAMSLFFWFCNIKPLYFNEKIVLAANLSDSNKCKEALEITNNSNWEKSGIIKPYVVLRHSDVIKKCTDVKPEKEVEYVQKSLSLLKSVSQIQPKYSRTWFFMGAFANVLGAREKNEDAKIKILSEARVYLSRAIELSPRRSEFTEEVIKNYMLAEDYRLMEKTSQDCINTDPSQGFCYWYLGIAQIFMGNQEEGKKNIELSKEKNYNNPHYLQLGIAYISQKNYKDAADAYHMLIAIYPNNASYHATLAVLYKEIGNYEMARVEVMRVFELEPENPETPAFIKILLGIKPGDISLHYALVDIYKTLGNEEKHREELLNIASIYLQLIANNPSPSNHHLNLAYVYKELGEYEKAVAEALLVLELSPNSIKEVEDFFKLLPPKFLDTYQNYLKNHPEKFLDAYGHDIYGQYPEKK